MILLAVFGAVDEPLASCVMVQFQVYVSKWKLVCKFEILDRNFLLMFSFFFIIVFIYCPNVTFIIPPIWFHSEVAFLF